MKRTLYTFSLLVGLVNTTHVIIAMNNNVLVNQREETTLTILRKYVSLKKLLLNLGNLLIDDDNESCSDDDNDRDKCWNVGDIIKAIVEPLKFGEFPITVLVNQDGRQVELRKKIKHLFKIKNLKKFIIKVTKHYTEGKICMERFPEYICLLRTSLHQEKIEGALGVKGFLSLESGLLAVENRYKNNNNNNQAVPLDACVDFEEAPGFLGEVLKQYFHPNVLTVVLNSVLRKEKVEQRMLLGCFNFRSLVETMGFSNEDQDVLADALSGFVSILIASLQNQNEGIRSLFSYIGRGYQTSSNA